MRHLLILALSVSLLAAVPQSRVGRIGKGGKGRPASQAAGCTVTAASPSQANVATALSGRSSGDIVCIPAGSATWTSGVTIPEGVTLKGAGTPNSPAATTG